MSRDSILLVDDSTADLELNRMALEEAGCPYEIELAHGGPESVKRLEKIPAPRLVVLDLRMPLMSGLEVLRWARSQPKLKEMPFIVLTTSSLERDKREAETLGAAAYFEKPLGFDETVALARRILDLAGRA